MRASSSLYSSFSSPWPDPNSPILSKIDFRVPLPELLKWLDVRDTFLGENEKKQNITKALNLAQHCKHPSAVWLTSIFDGKEVSTKEEARKVFLLYQDARSLCFAWWLSDDQEADLPLLDRASEMGYAFASSSLFWELWCGGRGDDLEKAIRLADFAASLFERDGLFALGRCTTECPCPDDINPDDYHFLAKESLLLAAELGHIDAALKYTDLLGMSDPACWIWFSRAAMCGSPIMFLNFFSEQVEAFLSGSGSATIVFLIGRTLKGNIEMEKKEICRTSFKFPYIINTAIQAVSFYEHQVQCARLAVDTWTLVSIRLHLIKDLRILIGKMIWEERFEANYKNDLR